jgi:two-component system, chemotaxis family, protein-glutamate methylesterase/glutaminase
VPRKPKSSASARRYGRYDLIAIGASAGGFHALVAILNDLPEATPAVVVVQHLNRTHKSRLAPLLQLKTRRAVKQAEHAEPLLADNIYIAPPDEHLLVGPGKIQLVHSQLVHFSRPSIDLLFESVAGVYGSRSIAIILSGSNDDGASGIRAVREAGGTTIAQDPKTAEFPIMPRAAIQTGCVDYVVDVDSIGGLLTKLCKTNQYRQ